MKRSSVEIIAIQLHALDIADSYHYARHVTSTQGMLPRLDMSKTSWELLTLKLRDDYRIRASNLLREGN